MKKILAVVLLLSLTAAAGCSHHSVQHVTADNFDQDLERLISEVIESRSYKPAEISPFAVLSASAVDGQPFSGLDEIICTRLSQKLAVSGEKVTLSRENWLEFKTSQTISLKGHPIPRQRLIKDLIIFIVHVEPEPVFNRIRVSVVAKDRHLNTIPGIKAAINLEYREKSLAFVLHHQTARTNPFPEGLEQHPYHSIEEMAYSMASDLSYAAHNGLKTQSYIADDKEIQVVLCSRNNAGPDSGFQQVVLEELQQALVAMKGIVSSISQVDLESVLTQMNLYKQNKTLFEQEFEKFKPGSVILMAETRQSGNRYHVALRAVWRISPLQDKQGSFIPENSSGTYLSGFTSRAWFKGAVSRPAMVRKIRARAKSYAHEPAMGFD